MQWLSSERSGMNGLNNKRFLLDTNAIIALLRGNKVLVDSLENAGWIGTSILSIIEFLSFPKISETDTSLFNEFIKRIFVVDIRLEDQVLLSNIIRIRKSRKLKLPDAIIVSAALSNDCILITADRELLRLSDIEILSFEP